MARVSIQFVNIEHIKQLMGNQNFHQDIAYLTPDIQGNTIILNDPVTHHSGLQSESVVLEAFARGFKQVVYEGVTNQIEFLSAFANRWKIGLKIGNNILISSTQVEH